MYLNGHSLHLAGILSIFGICLLFGFLVLSDFFIVLFVLNAIPTLVFLNDLVIILVSGP
jgi:hypothetical protein